MSRPRLSLSTFSVRVSSFSCSAAFSRYRHSNSFSIRLNSLCSLALQQGTSHVRVEVNSYFIFYSRNSAL